MFGSDICTCRPYLIYGIEEAVKEAQKYVFHNTSRYTLNHLLTRHQGREWGCDIFPKRRSCLGRSNKGEQDFHSTAHNLHPLRCLYDVQPPNIVQIAPSFPNLTPHLVLNPHILRDTRGCPFIPNFLRPYLSVVLIVCCSTWFTMREREDWIVLRSISKEPRTLLG